MSPLHHFVPKFVLREFAGQGGRDTLLRLRLSSGVVEPRNLNKQTAIRGHNTISRSDGSTDEAWERAFSALESEIAPAARAVARGQLVGLQAIALLLMLQVARTPVGRQATADEAHWQALYDNVKELRDHLRGRAGVALEDLDAGPARELVGVALSCLQAPMLMKNCSWVFVTPADRTASFVLGDHPAAPLTPASYGWQGVVMPLAPRSAVCVTFGAPALGAALLRLPKDHVDGLNRVQLRLATKHAFGLRPDLERAWSRLRETSDDEEISPFGACLDACHRSTDAPDGVEGVLRVGRASGFRAPIVNDAFGPWGRPPDA